MTRFLFLALVIIMVVSACGFHLRGSSQIAERLHPLYLEQGQLDRSRYSRIKAALLQASGGLSKSAVAANQLHVTFSAIKSHKLAESGATGVDLVQLELQLDYRVQGQGGDLLIKNRQVIRRTELELDNSDVLSSESIVNRSVRTLESNLIRTMINQLSN